MPNLHPIFVHFPVALLAMSALCEVLALTLKYEELSRVGWWTQLAGTVGVGAAVTSGLLAEGSRVFSPEARRLFEMHEQLAFYFSALFGALLLWRIASRSKVPPEHRTVYVVLLAAGVVIMLIGAWYGGEMVYRMGVGVRSLVV